MEWNCLRLSKFDIIYIYQIFKDDGNVIHDILKVYVLMV